jgi:hypothetical protein
LSEKSIERIDAQLYRISRPGPSNGLSIFVKLLDPIEGTAVTSFFVNPATFVGYRKSESLGAGDFTRPEDTRTLERPI